MSILNGVTVAIIGAGSVGFTLATRLARNTAAKLTIGARNVAKTQADVTAKSEAAGLAAFPVSSTEAAVAAADVVILATPGAHDDAGIRELAATLGDATGKVVIDATNPLSSFPTGLAVRWELGTSGGEALQAALPGAAVYKVRLCRVSLLVVGASWLCVSHYKCTHLPVPPQRHSLGRQPPCRANATRM
jgi:predicted dinucleotide-binding enzyme